MSIIIFLIVLFVLVLVHEWGHFIAARKTGMRVDEFSIGFPPRLFGIKKGETTYNINLLPIGGYVRIYGENKEEGDDEQIDSNRAFSARPKWAQAIVLLAGVFMNILLAWFLFTVIFISGVPTAVEESEASAAASLYVAEVLEESPADGQIPVGSIIQSVSSGGETIDNPTPSSFINLVEENAPSPITVTYTQGDEENTVILEPEQGLSETTEDRYVIGASLTLVETVKQPIFTAIKEGFLTTVNGLVAITIGLYTLIHDAVVAEADFSTIAGPVGIVGMVGDAASIGILAVLSFTAIISLNLAIINLLPFPALDGGRLLFVIIETITRKEIPPVWAGRMNLVGFALLMVLMVLVTINDIARLL